MENYIYKPRDKKYSELTIAEAQNYDDHNNKVYQGRLKILAPARDLISEVGLDKNAKESLIIKLIEVAAKGKPLNYMDQRAQELRKMSPATLKDQYAQKSEETKLVQDRIKKAKMILVDYGVPSGYNDENAEHCASNLLFGRAATAKIDELSGTYTAFEGDEDCDNCAGWDGMERRCECGNRRVNWTVISGIDPLSITKDDLYPEAY